MVPDPILNLSSLDEHALDDSNGLVHGRVWHDWNYNGIQDPYEPGIAGVEIELNGTRTHTTFTDANGEYVFSLSSLNLQPDDYELWFYPYSVPYWADFTIPNVVVDADSDAQENDAYDSDIDDNPTVISIEAGQRLDIDLGIISEDIPYYPDFTFDLSQSYTTEGEDVAVTIAPTTPYGNTLTTYEINWGDGSGSEPLPHDDLFPDFSNSATIHHVYQQEGIYNVSITAIDGENDTVTQTQTIVVQNIVPTFEIDAPFYHFDHGPVLLEVVPQPPDANGTEEEAIALTIDWGDGTVSTLDGFDATLPAHYYETGGEYLITVAATDDDGDTVTQTQLVYVETVFPEFEFTLPVLRQPNQAITPDVTALHHEQQVTYTLDWGNGDIQAFSEDTGLPSYTYTDEGLYTVTITATDQEGNTVQHTRSILIGTSLPQNNTPFLAEFGHVRLSDTRLWEDEVTVSLRLDHSDPQLDYTIDWGDGAPPEPLIDPWFGSSYEYSRAGDYIITVTATDDQGNEHQAKQSILVVPRRPYFTMYTPPDVLEDEQFFLGLQPKGDLENYTIDWGDGSLSTLQDGPGHRYDNEGHYLITVTTVDEDGDEITQARSIVVLPDLPIFSLEDEDAVTEGQEYVPSITSAAVEFVTYQIDWGDGEVSEPFSDLTEIPAHIYATSGTYALTVTATDDDGDRIVQSQSLIIEPEGGSSPTPPEFQWEFNSNGYYYSQRDSPIAYENSPIHLDLRGEPAVYRLDWGDGSAVEVWNSEWGRLPQPTHHYSESGHYPVTVTAVDTNGEVYTRTQTVTVLDDYPFLSPELQWSQRSPWSSRIDRGQGELLTFEERTVDLLIEPLDYDDLAYTIDWGDGSISQGLDPNQEAQSHTYKEEGLYPVTITVTDNDGDRSQMTQTLDVRSVVPRFSMSHFRDEREDRPVSLSIDPRFVQDFPRTGVVYTIDWGDGSAIQQIPTAWNSGSLNANHIYTDDGYYEVTVTAMDDDGETFTQTQIVTIQPSLPDPALTVPESITTNEIVQPDIQEEGLDAAIAYSLDWGDGSEPIFWESGMDSPSYQYSEAGGYTVTLTALDDDGDIVTVTEAITALSPGSPNRVEGSPQDDVLTGTPFNDRLSGGFGRDTLRGRSGEDILIGGPQYDRLWGGGHSDTLQGGAGNDMLQGEAGNDTLRGSYGNDRLSGGRGTDWLVGGRNDDVLDGGLGRDRYSGGLGSDTFILRLGEGGDIIQDFRLSQGDTIALADGLAFEDLTIERLGNRSAQLLVEEELLAIVHSNRFDTINTEEAFASL